MKAYTDISQSKKLAEILSLESADMCWFEGEPFVEAVTGYEEERAESHRQAGMEMYPCWSLAALLELLPKRIEIVDNVYELSIYLYGIYYWNINNGNLCFKSKDKDSLVDACYEAIVFLHEQKLL